jgi:uncharacterized protein YaaR (DUF327 family)
MRIKAFLGILVLSALLVSACKKDDEGTNCSNYANAIQEKLDAVVVASEAFSTDPSTANCNAYKTAVSEYLDTAENFIECVPAEDRAQYQQDIDDLQAEIDQLSC